MTLTQLRIFVTVAELGHVTRAAEQLGITQSAASAAIRALEDQYEVTLFDRVGRSLTLSETGQVFLVEAQAVLDRARLAQRALRELGGTTVGHLDIAASQTIANYWLPRRLAVFHERYPAIALNVAISNTQGVADAVLRGDADIGFVEGATHEPELMLDEVDRDQMVLVVSPRRAPPAGVGTKNVDLTRLPLIVRERGSGTRAMLADFAAASGLRWQDLNVVLELPSNEAVREAVEAGAGAALISRHVIASSLAAGRLRALPLDVPPRSYRMVRYRHRQANPARRALVEMILAGQSQAA